jgi:hypothetical protein
MDQLEVLTIVVRKLTSLGVEYMLSGSVAMNFYGQPRMTRDIDIVVVIEEPEIHRFIQAFEGEFYIESETVLKEVLKKGMFNAIHNEYIIKIDFILRKDAQYDIVAFGRRRLVLVDDLEIYIISPEDLILNKLLWAKESNSEIQRKDVSNILVMTEDLDLDYLRKWSQQLDVATLLDRCST